MKSENKIEEITFENFIQLRDVLEEAWLRGRLEQSIEDVEKEGKSYDHIARKLGIKNLRKPIIKKQMVFQEWFLELIKKIKVN